MTVESLDIFRARNRSFAGARVLIVDDEMTMRRILRQFLENAGYHVSEANSGTDAISCLENEKFDIMLLDILMPDMLGLDVLKLARKKYTMSQLPIIMVTINEENSDIVGALSLGANDYIVKPITFDVMRARIQTHLSYSRAETELRTIREELEIRVDSRTTELLDSNRSLEREINERKQIEDALRESHKFLNAVIEEAPDFIFARDLQGRYTVINNAAAMAIGKAIGDIIGKTNFDILDPDEAIKLDEEDKKLIASGSSHSFEQAKLIDGSSRTILTTEYLHRDKDGSHKGILSIGRDITEQKLAEEKIRHQANHDELTGLPTLRLGKDRLTNAIALARRNKVNVAVLFLDLDGFKEVNDSMGHRTGDLVLTEVASRLSHTIRETDTVARLGGDEFIIVLTELVEQSAHVMAAEKIVKSLAQPMQIEGKDVNISASIGIALYPKDGDTTDELISKADEAMYVAKHQGKNNFAVA